jgi:hypothetical protein
MVRHALSAVRQLARDRLHDALWAAGFAILLTVLGSVAAGLAAAAGIIVTADRIGLVPALLAWAGGALAAAILVFAARRIGGRRRRIPEQAYARQSGNAEDPANLEGGIAALLSNAGFKAGVEARNAMSPLGAAATAFVIGVLVARTRR